MDQAEEDESFHDCEDVDPTLVPPSPTNSNADETTVTESVFGQIVQDLETTANDTTLISDMSIASECMNELINAAEECLSDKPLEVGCTVSQTSTINRTLSGLVDQVVDELDGASQSSVNNFITVSTQGSTASDNDLLSVCSSTTSGRSQKMNVKFLTEASFLFGDIEETEIDSNSGNYYPMFFKYQFAINLFYLIFRPVLCGSV